MIKTVLGEIKQSELGITLAHEHICCFSEYLYRIAGNDYLDKKRLEQVAISFLKEMKEKHGLSSIVDCTPVNIGRDIELLKRVSDKAEINIVCSTGFYYTEEPLMYNLSAFDICKFIVADARAVNSGVIKCAVEASELTHFSDKLLRASAKAHLQTGLPIVLHTNATNKNALTAIEILLSEGVKPRAITAGHLSDTNNMEFVKGIARLGCFIGLDRLYSNTSEEYISEKVKTITELCDAGYQDKIILSHDALFFNGFDSTPKNCEKPRLTYVFERILPRLKKEVVESVMVQNPIKMLIKIEECK